MSNIFLLDFIEIILLSRVRSVMKQIGNLLVSVILSPVTVQNVKGQPRVKVRAKGTVPNFVQQPDEGVPPVAVRSTGPTNTGQLRVDIVLRGWYLKGGSKVRHFGGHKAWQDGLHYDARSITGLQD